MTIHNTTHIPEWWRETTLGEIVTIWRWSSPRPIQDYLSDFGIPWVKISDATASQNRFIEWTKEYIKEEGRSTSVQPGNLLVSNSATPWIPKFMRIHACVHDWWLVFSNYKELNNDYLYYFFLDYRRHLEHSASWTVFKNLTTDIVRHVPILLPPLPEQRAIADILSSLDAKIELLRDQNEILEKTAQTIFQEWFMDNETYPRQRLWDLMIVKRWWSPRPIQDYLQENGLRWLKISDASATQWPYIFEIKECIKEEWLRKTIHLDAWSLVLSNSATPWIPKILAVDSCIHDGWLYFPKSNFSNEFLFLLFQTIRPLLIQQWSGSVFTNLKTDILKDFEAPLPDDDILKAFDNVVKPIFSKIYNNSLQIQSLSKTRDTLLPKLMSGEVRVA